MTYFLYFCFHLYKMRAAAAAAKSLQSCLTLCDPIDSSPSGSLVPGILQARTLEQVAVSFSRHNHIKGQPALSIQGWILTPLGFVGGVVSVIIAQLCQSSPRQCANERAWLHLNKTLLVDTEIESHNFKKSRNILHPLIFFLSVSIT